MKKFLNTIDGRLDRITMYRAVLYYVAALTAAAFVLGALELLPISPRELLFSTVLALAVGWVVNKVFAWGYDAPANVESVYITAFIIVLIMPLASLTDAAAIGALVFATAWAMGSKFILAYHRKHVFNPAALGVAASSLFLGISPTWWVAGNIPLLPFVLIGGLLVVRKIRRFDLIFSFFVMLAAVMLATMEGAPWSVLSQTFLHTSALFFAFAMLSEPLTMPPTRVRRIAYGVFTAALFAPTMHMGGMYFTPETALLAGNIFAALMSPKSRLMLTLTARNKLAEGVHEFVFATDRTLRFTAGQYLEWTLGHAGPDNRGNRRYFTISSSPEDKGICMGVKFYDKPSSFKLALSKLRLGDTLSASHLAGDFCLPRNTKRKLAFVAGGIGITPFTSMTRYLLDSGEARDIVLLYGNKTAAEIAYGDVFDAAAQAFGMKTVSVLSDEAILPAGARGGYIDAACIAAEVPDFRERIFYISGPHGMVTAVESALRTLGVSSRRIKKDFFPGLV